MTSAIMEQDEDDEFDGLFHMVPTGDVRVHECSLECWCGPEVDDEDDEIVIHFCGSGLPH